MDDRQQRAKRYEATHNWLFLVEVCFLLAILLAFLLSDGSQWLADRSRDWTANEWLQVLIYGAFLILGYTLLSLPLTYYSGFHLEHRFGLSNQTLKDWVLDQLKSLLLTMVIGLLMLEVLYFLLRAAGESWWIWTGAAFILFGIVLSHLMPVVIVPLFYKVKPIDDKALAEKLATLANRVGAKLIGVFRIDLSAKTKKANAAFAGLGSTRRILLGDTLLNNFTHDEVEVVLAHEMAHYKHRDIWLMMAVGSASTFVGLYVANSVLKASVAQFGFDGISDFAAFPLFALCMFLFGLITMPINNGFSRWREFLADRKALQLTGKKEAFVSAMNKLAEQNLADANPHPVIEFLLHDHPALSRRIAAAEEWARE